MQTLWQDIHFALRQLRKPPGFGATAIQRWPLALGPNVAISTLIDDALLRSLPVLHPDDLVTVGFKGPKLKELVPVQSIYGLEQLRRQLRSDEGFSSWSGDMLSVPDQRGTLRSIEGGDGERRRTRDVRPPALPGAGRSRWVALLTGLSPNDVS